MRFYRLVLLPLVSMVAGLFAQAPNPMTIDQVIDEALVRNLRLMADRYDLPIADARILQARLRPNPALNIQAGYLDILGAGYDLARNPAGPPEFDAGVNFLIEQRGKREARVRLATAIRSVVEMDFQNKTRLLILDLQTSFVDLQLAKNSLTLQRENQKSFETIVELNSVRVKAGDLAQVELTRSELAALQLQNLIRQGEARVQVAKNRLQTLMGRSLYAADFDVDGDLRSDELAKTLEELRTSALDQRADLLTLRRDLTRAEADLNYQRKFTIGDTQFQILANKQWDVGILRGRSLTFNLLQPLPLFNRNQGEIQRATQERIQVQHRIRALEAEIHGDLQNGFALYSTARRTLEAIRGTMLDRARRVRDTMEYSYRRGEATFVEFLDAQRAFNETMQTFNEARAEYARTLYLIESVTGFRR